jgi:hypothetical protein
MCCHQGTRFPWVDWVGVAGSVASLADQASCHQGRLSACFDWFADSDDVMVPPVTGSLAAEPGP